MKIFKYYLAAGAEINIVRGPIVKPLRVEFQRGVPCLWAVVDTHLSDREYEVICVGTGQEMLDVSLNSYLNTTLSENGYLVLHWFCSEVQEGVSV